jgi:hypothetical protein
MRRAQTCGGSSNTITATTSKENPAVAQRHITINTTGVKRQARNDPAARGIDSEADTVARYRPHLS